MSLKRVSVFCGMQKIVRVICRIVNAECSANYTFSNFHIRSVVVVVASSSSDIHLSTSTALVCGHRRHVGVVVVIVCCHCRQSLSHRHHLSLRNCCHRQQPPSSLSVVIVDSRCAIVVCRCVTVVVVGVDSHRPQFSASVEHY